MATTFAVYSTAGQFDVLPPSARAVLGEYAEEGSNHGKRVYRRVPDPKQKALPEVVLFFWDMRDGKDLAGWWFGDKIGGGQVWARNQSMSAAPPQRGWRCPVDGPPQPHVLCAPKVSAKAEVLDDAPSFAPSSKRPADRSLPEPPRKRLPPQTLVLAAGQEQDAPKKVQALLGEYVQMGENHGRRTYARQAGDGSEAVWLYYWDHRDGRDSSGWWLGSSVGGDEVFGHVEQHSATPPTKGWRIPQDGAKTDVQLTVKGHDEDAKIPEEDRLQKVKELVSSQEAQVDKAIGTSRSMLDSEGDVFEDGIRAVCQLLESRVVAVEGAKASAARHTKAAKKQRASNESEAELGLQEERLDSCLGKAMKELQRAQESLQRCEREGAEERDARAIEEALPGAMELVTEVEMAVNEAKSDEAAMQANDLIRTAREQVGKTLEAARGYAPDAQKLALTEFNALQARCEAAEKHLALWGGSGLNTVDEVVVDDAEPEDAEMAAEPAAEAPDAMAEPVADVVEDGDDADIPEEDAADAADADVPEEELLKQMTAKVADVEKDAKQALETATVVLKGDSDSKGLRLCLGLLEEQHAAICKAQRSLSEDVAAASGRELSPAVAEAMRALSPRLQVVRARVSQELALAKRQVAKEQQQAREDRDVEAAEGALPLAMESVDQAEAAVEAVIEEAGDLEWRRKQMEIALQFGDEYGDEIQRAMEETQIAAEAAQDAISGARTRLDAQIKAARLLSEERQKETFAEMAPLRKRLIDSQKKLNPYKRVKADFDQQLKAKMELEGLSSRVAKLEADIEGAGRAFEESLTSEDDMKSVETALVPAQAGLAKALKVAEQKSKGITGALQERLAGIQARARAAQVKLEELQGRAREERGQLAGQSLAGQAKRAAERAEAWLVRIKEAEAPWQAGQEVLPEAKARPALVAAEALAKEAMPAVEAAKTTVMEQLVEARQLPEGILRLQTTSDLQQLQARVEAVVLKLTQLKIDTFARKTKLQMTEVIEAVAKAEAEATKIVKAAEPFAQDNLETAAAKMLKEVSAEVTKCVAPLTKVCTAARAAAEKKQQDPRNKTSPSFQTQLSKLVARLEAVEATVSGMQRAVKECQGNKKLFDGQRQELARLEQRISDVELQALPLGDEQPTEQQEEVTALALRDAEEALGAWREAAGRLAKNPHGAMGLAMGRLVEQGEALQRRLAEAAALTREPGERALCRIFVREAQAELKKGEAALAKAEAAEGPFLTGIEVLSSAQSAETIAACEKAAGAARQVLAAAHAAVEGRHGQAIGFRREDEGSRRCAEELAGLLRRVAGLTEKLGQLERDTQARKRRAEEQAKGEPAAKAARKA
mmetsp:Transcript_48804/g.139632  ORF Transcript_48804/g.139632 Transcript_48804/m.139632 type:complete len:1345 (-) Transcript_48804:165-4199(-)